MNEVFKIVRIVNDRNIVINAGNDQGLKEGDILEVFVPGEEIIDIDTGELLGTLDIIKAKLEIKNLYEKMSLCHNAQTSTKNVLYESAFLFSKTTRLPLDVDMTQAQKLNITSDNVLRLGDLVRKAL